MDLDLRRGLADTGFQNGPDEGDDGKERMARRCGLGQDAVRNTLLRNTLVIAR